MIVRIAPGLLTGTMEASASKSDTHRILIASALSSTPTEIDGLSSSDDVRATIDCLQAMGAPLKGSTMHPIVPNKTALLRCGESGTTLRFLLPVVGALGMQARFLAQGRLPQRPLSPLLDVMAAHGVSFDADHPPLTSTGRLQPGRYSLPGNISSQFISGLLLALSLLDSGGSIQLTTAQSSVGYVQMTLHTLDQFSITVIPREDGYFVPGSQRYRSPGIVFVERDWSNAAHFLAAGALGGPVTVRGLSMQSCQPDRIILELLQRFGAEVMANAESITVRGGALRGVDADVSDTPDLAPVLVALGMAASGTTRLLRASRLRDKESDRLSSLQAMARSLGGRAEVMDDILIVHGGIPLTGGEVDSASDHRIVMAAAIAATVCSGETFIHDAQAVNKSYPAFFSRFAMLGGKCDGFNNR